MIIIEIRFRFRFGAFRRQGHIRHRGRIKFANNRKTKANRMGMPTHIIIVYTAIFIARMLIIRSSHPHNNIRIILVFAR